VLVVYFVAMKYLAVLLLCVCTHSLLAQSSSENLIQYVNPFIGTHKMGHTYPGATVPFGMVQLSPETDTLLYEHNGKYNGPVYKYCAGYQYDDPTIVGFSHTHFSGTGHSDLGDILVMPTQGKLQLNSGTEDHPERGYRSVFSHSSESAEPNYYRVKLDDHQITAELTTSERVGFHRYTFPASDQSHIIVDLVSGIYNYPDKNVWTFVRIENDTLITGYRQTSGWARTRTVYFAIAFSKPFHRYGNQDFSKPQVYKGFWGKFNQRENFPEVAGRQIKLYFDFNTTQGEKVAMKVALSPVSTQGALNNMRSEIPHWDFDRVKKEGQDKWNNELRRISVTAPQRDDYVNFYTAMYHTFLGPTTYMDVDHAYRGLDQNDHVAKDFTNYTTFSLWDTYRALHPYFTIVQPKRNQDMVRSMLAHYDQSVHNMLPVWSHYANENWCMIGYHSVSVAADALLKDPGGIDLNKALDACVTTARQRYYGALDAYIDNGYVPDERSTSSVSMTLEYAYDDWCIAQLAKKLNRKDIADEFMARAQNWKNVFDKSIGYTRPKLNDGTFRKEFDVLSTHGQGFIEGNAWNYSLYAPQDPPALINMMGGNKKFTQHLDSLFTMYLPDKFFAETEDITREGIIGNYVHGNEPAHHVPYLYNWAGAPWKTQERVRMILKKQYQASPDGLGGNDDCGQMSAWYIFSSMGFYPVAPGSGQYSLGSPALQKAIIRLENGNSFTIDTKNQSEKNVYVAKVELNGQPLSRLYITHDEIMAGGKLTFHMAPKPKK
jgi:predicted alpha-1,2-mannosidase